MNKYSLNNNDEGFSLVEVLIAIAILAILSFPLLGYFSDALSTTSRGKFTQRAEMAGQSIIEEIDSYNTYGQIEKTVAASGSAWSVDVEAEAKASASPDPTPTPDPSNPMTPVQPFVKKYIRKNIKIDGKDMLAKVKIDFDYTTGATGALYNNYEVPQLKALYSDHSVVGIESDQKDYAISEFYYRERAKGNTSITKSVIEAGLDRDIHMDIGVSPEDSNVLKAKIYYVYSYNDGVNLPQSYISPMITSTDIAKEDFTHFYLLFNPNRDSSITEKVYVNWDASITIDEQLKMNIYYICQDHVPAGYKLEINGVGAAKSYTNGIGIVSSGSTKNTYIDKLKMNRIANITVDIYNEGETTFNEDTRVLQIKSSKGE